MVRNSHQMKTVSSILKEARGVRGETYEDVARALKIQPKFLEALEEGDYSAFSSPIHVKGFLKNYAEYLDLDVEGVLAFWRREYNENQDTPTLKNRFRPLHEPKLMITPNLVALVGTGVVVLGFFAYLFYQYYSFARPPALEVTEPAEDVRQAETSINVLGRVETGSELTINGQVLQVSPDGSFGTTVGLSEGINNLHFLATNQAGKTSEVARMVIVESPYVYQGSASPAAGLSYVGVELRVQAEPNGAWIQVSGSEEVKFEGMLVAGAERVFRDEEFLKIKTGNAGSTRVVVNGHIQEPLGEEGAVAEKEWRAEAEVPSDEATESQSNGVTEQ